MDSNTRREKRQALMAELVERKVRNRARELYETRGQADGSALEDWVRAESEVLKSSIMAPLYRKVCIERQQTEKSLVAADLSRAN